MSCFSISNWTRVATLVSLLWVLPARGALSNSFPGEEIYDALYGQALNQGYADIAQGVSVFKEYRKGLHLCTEQKSESARAFSLFLDGVVRSIRGHLNHPQLLRRSYRDTVSHFITHSSAWIILYAREKALRFNGAETRLDSGDERLVRTTTLLHSRVSSLLRVGGGSLEGTIAYWKRADKAAALRNAQVADAARAVMALDPKSESYCKIAL